MHVKRQRLTSILRDCRSVVVGYSGGVDSVLLAKVALDALGPERVLAVTGTGPSVAAWSLDTARRVAREFHIPWLELPTYEANNPEYAANPTNRCFFCKTELYTRLRAVARERGFRSVLNGTNADDVGDHRPGQVAAAEHGVRSPFLEAGVTKGDIRAWSRDLELPTWDQPASPCLASRLPYGFAVTPERLRQVEEAEDVLRRLGLREVRVRHHHALARVEVAPGEISRARDRWRDIRRGIEAAGFDRVELDEQGYRRGSLNEDLSARQLVRLSGAS